MNPGYFSEAAVKDLLAVKTGEIDFLRKQVELLTSKCDLLSAELARRDLVKCACS
jgi:hypothetical protein